MVHWQEVVITGVVAQIVPLLLFAAGRYNGAIRKARQEGQSVGESEGVFRRDMMAVEKELRRLLGECEEKRDSLRQELLDVRHELMLAKDRKSRLHSGDLKE